MCVQDAFKRPQNFRRQTHKLTCSLCGRKAIEHSGLCRYHDCARRRVIEAYDGWLRAYGALEWDEYLRRVQELEGSGQWAKEVAGHLRGKRQD
jgi:hypothetical protein